MNASTRSLILVALLCLAVVATLSVNRAAAADRVVVVRAGDTVSGIAVRFGVPIETIVALNRLSDPDRILVGQRLRLRPSPATGRQSVTRHRVAPGETLSGLALRYGSSVAAIARANAIGDPSYVQAGRVIRIPRARGSSADGSRRARPGTALAAATGREAMRRLIVAEARRQGVPVAFALALAWQESGWRQEVVSSAGAVGVMQLLPATGAWVSASILREPVNIWRARSNVRAGVALLRFYLDRYGWSRPMALAAYYQGMTGADRHGIYAMTRPYVASILALEARFRG